MPETDFLENYSKRVIYGLQECMAYCDNYSSYRKKEGVWSVAVYNKEHEEMFYKTYDSSDEALLAYINL